MKRSSRLLTVLAVSCWFGVQAPAQETGASRETDHQALRQLRANVMTAVSNQDIKVLATYFAKDFVFVSADQTVITNREGLTAYYARLFTAATAPIAKIQTAIDADILTRFTDPNTGYCYGSSLTTYNLKSGRMMRMKERWTATVVREAGEWRIAAAHVGVDFLDNPYLRTRTLSIWQKMGIGLGLSQPPSD
jgi:uncharacterized protein (TIGR02246 family)